MIYYHGIKCASLAQLDRAFGYEPEGRGFESRRAYHFLFFVNITAACGIFFVL